MLDVGTIVTSSVELLRIIKTMTVSALVPTPATPTSARRTGLILSGGGARAAYQVGVLEAIADLRIACGVQHEPSPFPIIGGASAGAINAAALACGSDNFDNAVRRIVNVWANFHAHQVYRADSVSMLRSGARWMTVLSLGWLIAKWRRLKPKSLLDNTPLSELLTKLVPLERIPKLIDEGHLQALAVSVSSYSTGEHVTFFQGHAQLKPWARLQRRAIRADITHQHLLASSAIPFVFPAVALQMDDQIAYFGDGSMRQSAPISPAIHLGADRICVIGAARTQEPRIPVQLPENRHYPTLAQIAGHALSSIFLESLAVDIERVQRINQTLSLVPEDLRNASNLRPVELLVISPSERIDMIAARYVDDLPAPVRTLLGGVGVSSNVADIKGSALASYLLFEQGFTRELMALGRKDTLHQRAEVCRFFGWTDPEAPAVVPVPPVHLGVERRRDPLRLR